MALIKCVDCGNQVSDKSKECPKCGCPIEESIIIICEECGNKISNNASSCSECGCPVNVSRVSENKIVYKKEKKYDYNDDYYFDKEIELAKVEIDVDFIEKWRKIFLIMAIISCFTIIIPIYLLIIRYLYGQHLNNRLVLTNKRIKGSLRVWFSYISIDIPLDKIDNIYTTSAFGVNSIVISSASGTKRVGFAKNCDSFCSIAMSQIERYKEYIYKR